MNFGSIPRQRDPHFDALDNLLKQTLNEVAKQIGLESNDSNFIPQAALSLKDQTQTDIEQANNNVLQALKELQDLKAI
jgi:predicted nucleotide-binding protein (sugar kinase/HSP70/actin superfamily)